MYRLILVVALVVAGIQIGANAVESVESSVSDRHQMLQSIGE